MRSRIRELTQATTGTAVPVAREADFVAALGVTPLVAGNSSVDLMVWAQNANGGYLTQPMWGFVTVTDNVTQQVTIVTP